MDVVDRETRSRMMRGIGPQNTAPELIVRRALHASGLRFRLHARDLPGSPDIVLPKYRSVVFVHGCFWHRHAGCRYCTTPKSNAEFWSRKFAANVERDRRQRRLLQERGWKVFTVWECQLGKPSFLVRLASRIRTSARDLSTRSPK